MDIGFLGLGRMGSAMALRLLEAGHSLTVYNRSRARAQPLESRGARVAASVADACAAPVVISMLADDAAVGQLAFGEAGVIARLAPGAVHLCMATISVEMAERLAAAHVKAGQGYASAPVFGRPEAAAAGKLFFVTAGDAQALTRCAPLLEVLGQRRFHFGERPATANLIKLSGNFLIASVIETLGEALALVGKAGVDPAAYMELLTSTLFAAPVYRTYGELLAQRRFEPAGFAAPLGLKDIRLTLAAAEGLRVPLPVASLLRDRFLSLLAQPGGERLDWSAIGALTARDAGLEP